MKKLSFFSLFFAATLLILFSCKEESLNLSPENSAWSGQTRAAIESLNANGMRVLSSSESSLVMELKVGNYAKNAVSIEGKDYFSITARDAHSMLQKGNPDLPEYAYSVVIPQTSACNVRVVNAEYEDITLPIAPSKGRAPRKTEPSAVPYTFSEVYEKDAFYPSQLASADAPFLMRDVRGSVVRLHPFQYNPVTGILRVYKKMEVEVSFSGTDTRNVQTSGVRHTIDKSMEELFRNQFINYDVMAESSINNTLSNLLEKDNDEKGEPATPPIPPDPPQPVPTEKMLIICCDSFATDMSMFIYYKNIWGISTRLVTMSQVGTSADNVRNFIQVDYNANPNLTYVLLVGDAERVPTKLCEDGYFHIPGGADPMYALVSGTDSIPDIVVGRFSARNRSEVQTMVSRTVSYENQSVQTWQHQSIGISDGGTCFNISTYNYEYMDSIMDMLTCSLYGIGGVERLYACNSTTATCNNPSVGDILYYINQGAFVVNYIGEGSFGEWEIGTNGNHFNINSIGYLQNNNKLPFIYNGGSYVGDFTNGSNYSTFPCFAEAWLTARNSVSGAAIGAIGFYAPSIGSPDIEYVSAAIAFNSLLTVPSSNSNAFGALCYASAINMRNQYGSAANDVLMTLNYFGDPSLKAYPNEYVLDW